MTLSRNARSDTPLAREYREAKAAYKRAGRALRSSCSAKSRKCGYSRPVKLAGRKRFRFVSSSTRAMKSEFLGAPAGASTNESVIREAIGHLDVKDTTQWECVSEKYGKKAETFDQAFTILARQARKDWRKFDIATLRECSGLGTVDLPAFMHDARTQEEIETKYSESEEVPF